MSIRNVEQGIAAIQQGNLKEGARLIRIGLKSEELQGPVRATAYLWLAETVHDAQQKIGFYNQALAADPVNQHARQRVSMLLAADLPQTPPQQLTQPTRLPGQSAQFAAQAPQYNPNAIYRTVGIFDGPNGPGTGIIISRDGVIATSRFVVGGEQHVIIKLDAGQGFSGQVVRSYPHLDLALIQSGLAFHQLLSAAPTPMIPDNTPLTAFTHNGQSMTGQKRTTRSRTSAEWFPTTIARVMDAGGNPVFDNQNTLVGMLTRNANRTSAYVFALSIDTIYRHAEQFRQESQKQPTMTYCPHCGNLSRAGGAGGYYCEICGGILPAAENVARYELPHLAQYYNENAHRACGNCGARVGYYDGFCLRCGHAT